MIRRAPQLGVAIAAIGLSACAGASVSAGIAMPVAPAVAGGPDVVVVAPRAYDEALAPLLAHRRAQGLDVFVLHVEDVPRAADERLGGVVPPPTPEAVLAAIEDVAPPGGPRFVLLAGDPVAGPSPVPAFRAEAPRLTSTWAEPGFATDHPYAAPGRAVGRLPAQDARELAVMVDKILRYERAPGGPWQRRVVVAAGPADFGPVIDAIIEAEAARLLDQRLPHDRDLALLFAQPRSPYAYRLDRFGQKIMGEIEAGAFLAVYVGHGERHALDEVAWRDGRWPIATTADVDGLGPSAGQPLFFALTCHTGAFGLGERRSWGERLVLHPHGPVGVFASSHVSFPYPNFLYAEALLEVFTEERPATLGEGVGEAKRRMVAASVPLYAALEALPEPELEALHLRLYNLFGDPATRLRHPARARVGAELLADGTVAVAIEAPRGATSALVSIETERHVLKPGRTSPAELDALAVPDAFDRMEMNHALAVDKVVARATAELGDGIGVVSLPRPAAPGVYLAKVLVPAGAGVSDVAIGHARFVVR